MSAEFKMDLLNFMKKNILLIILSALISGCSEETVSLGYQCINCRDVLDGFNVTLEPIEEINFCDQTNNKLYNLIAFACSKEACNCFEKKSTQDRFCLECGLLPGAEECLKENFESIYYTCYNDVEYK